VVGGDSATHMGAAVGAHHARTLNRSFLYRVRIKGLRLLLIFVFAVLPSLVHSQQREFPMVLHSAADSVVVLPDNFPDFSSLQIQVDSSFVLHSPNDYLIDTIGRRIYLSSQTRSLLFPLNAAPGVSHKLSISYFALPLSIPSSYSLGQLEAPKLSDSIRALLDTSRHNLAYIATTVPDTNKADILSNFQKSGSISRGFQVGSNQDLGLTSGFNLQFSGDVARDVNITGALTEEQTPIQPEGTTQTLNEIDKVFIRIKAGQHFTSTLGDFDLDMNSPGDPTRLGNNGSQFQSVVPLGINTGPEDPFKGFNQSTFDIISRKLIGAEASAQFTEGSFTIAGASPRGQFVTNTFQGQESYQGPYTLSGKNGEPAIIVVAGTEHVYVDGVLQVRGERNDYIIDYGLGQIEFQPRRLITSDSRITVDFQYSDQQYSRSLFAANAKGELADGAFKISATYLREGDDQSAPLDLTLSDSDQTLLSKAGADPAKASKSAVTFAGLSPAGRAQGSYDRKDTLINNTKEIYYAYSPLDTANALYNIAFGYAGTGKGTYSRLAIGQFQFVGPGQGDYDTLSYLPLPQLHQVMAFNSSLRLTNNLGLIGEFASSNLNVNRFAAIPSVTGNAYRFGAMYADTLPILGIVALRATERNVAADFTPIDRIQDVEFERLYGNDNNPVLATSTTVSATSELNREATLSLRPIKLLILQGGFGDLEQPALQFSSSRLFGNIEILEDTLLLPHVRFNIERMPTHDSTTHDQALWNRLSGDLTKTFRIDNDALTLGVKYGEESKTATPYLLDGASPDSVSLQSFSYRTIGPIASIAFGPKLIITGEYNIRTDDSASNGALTQISNARTAHVTANLSGLDGFSSLIDLTLRDKRYTDSLSFVENGGDQSTVLLRFEPRYVAKGITAEAHYDISNQRAAQLQRVFLPVPTGLGTYTYLGDLNHDGRLDPNDFAPARYSDQANYILVTIPTQQLFPTTDLKSSFHLRIEPRDLFGLQQPASWLSEALSDVSSDSYIKLDETSTDQNSADIYLFRLSHFRTDSTTIAGQMQFSQDFNILENNPDESFRLHYLEREGAAQYNTGLENTFTAERSIRARFRLSSEFSNESTLTSTMDESSADTLSVNGPHNTATIALATDWSYHPAGSKFDYGARVELSNAVERTYSPQLTALGDAITLRSSYALESRARLRAEFERDELNLSQAPADTLSLPYALTLGRSIGVTWLWKLALDYQFGSGIVATFSYDGRNEAGDALGLTGERVTIHNARAEVRASF
jgi:hypothetical protein